MVADIALEGMTEDSLEGKALENKVGQWAVSYSFTLRVEHLELTAQSPAGHPYSSLRGDSRG